ncbi:AAA family ATPase, partial [Romboutsia sp.]|uniref:AAA family ATPase n=1 Tax=Romboutsia sp. TaxID=1965302 RepID=UPI003F37EEB8
MEKSNNVINKANNYLCITRPRRFGKSSVADMLGAYYSKAVDSKDIFDSLKISKSDSYDKHLNKYNVINISFNTIPDKNKTYDEYIGLVQNGIIDDIKSMYPTLD